MSLLHRALQAGRSRKVGDPERGDTLVEILIAIAILGISVTALLGALVTTITSASEHRSLASNDTVLRSYAEQLKDVIQLRTTGPIFTPCATVTSSNGYAGTTITPSNLPTRYTVKIQSIQWWNKETNTFDSPPTPCAANDNIHIGFQLITLQSTAPNGVASTLTIGVRQP